MKIFLDDTRDPEDVYGEDAENWVVARDYHEFKLLVQDWIGTEDPLFISFDHDLDPDHSGMDCAKMLADAGVVPDGWKVHSANPVGAENIRNFLQNWEDHAPEGQEKHMRQLTWHSQQLGLYEH